eukprot:NODE_232_length_12051_cov_1.040997.p9 type:complete len:113 gc:universal NODE_232_length_12051_cov_1.040997:5362-5700(+)
MNLRSIGYKKPPVLKFREVALGNWNLPGFVFIISFQKNAYFKTIIVLFPMTLQLDIWVLINKIGYSADLIFIQRLKHCVTILVFHFHDIVNIVDLELGKIQLRMIWYLQEGI